MPVCPRFLESGSPPRGADGLLYPPHKENPEWECAGIYADESISAMNTKSARASIA